MTRLCAVRMKGVEEFERRRMNTRRMKFIIVNLLLLCFGTSLSHNPVTVDKEGLAQIELSHPVQDNHAVPYVGGGYLDGNFRNYTTIQTQHLFKASSVAQVLGVSKELEIHIQAIRRQSYIKRFECTSGAPEVQPGSGLTLTVSNRAFVEGGTTADVTVVGGCSEGFVLSWSSKTVSCDYLTGWAEAPVCTIVQCDPLDVVDYLSPCSGPQDFGTICNIGCVLEPTGVNGTATCTAAKTWTYSIVCGVATMMTCGNGNKYALGNPATPNPMVYPEKHDLEATWGEVEHAAVTQYSLCAVSKTGLTRCFGNNNMGQAGGGSDPMTTLNSIHNFGQSIIQFEGGSGHYMALTESNQVYLWGGNTYNQLLQGTSSSHSSIPLLAQNVPPGNVVFIDAGYHASIIVLDSGVMFGAGQNYYNTLTPGSLSQGVSLPLTGLGMGEKVIQVTSTHSSLAVRTDAGTVYGRSNSLSGATAACLSAATTTFVKSQDSMNNIQGKTIDVACSRHSCLFRTNDEKIFVCSSSKIPEGPSSSATPVDLTATLNANCEGGKVNYIQSTDVGVFFGGSSCVRSKIFGWDQSGGNPNAVCRNNLTSGEIAITLDAGSKTIISAYGVQGNSVFLVRE